MVTFLSLFRRRSLFFVSFCHSLGPLCLCLAPPLFAQAPSPALAIQVSNETAPSGGWAQVKISLAAPALVASGRVVIDFDPSIFGNIAAAAVFSAQGDALASITVQAQHLDASFSSPSGGIGQLQNLPVLVATIPILGGVAPGTVAAVSADPSQSVWQDPYGNTYSVTATPGSVTVSGSLSIQNVSPGGGIVPKGGELRITGAGFTPQTAVTIDGVSISSTAFISPQEIDVTLAGPTEMTGKRVVVQDSGVSVSYFASLGGPVSSPSAQGAAYTNSQFTVPLEPQLTGIAAYDGGNPVVLALQNPSSVSVPASLIGFGPGASSASSSVTIPPLSTAVFPFGVGSLVVSAKAPLRMMEIISAPLDLLPPPVPPPTLLPVVAPVPVQQLQFEYSSGSFTWQIGTPLPQPSSNYISGIDPGIPFNYNLTASTAGGGSWLSVSPSQANSAPEVSISVSVNPMGLAPGTYTGTITATPTETNAQPATTPVTLIVIPANNITISPSYMTSVGFQVTPPGNAAGPDTLSIISGTPQSFSVTSSTQSGGKWFSVAVSASNTPATLTVTANASGLGIGTYTGSIVITGPQNSLTIPVTLQILGNPPFAPQPASLVFAGPSGGPSPQSQIVELNLSVAYSSNITLSTSTTSGGNWLNASFAPGPIPAGVSVGINSSGLAPGTYYGILSMTSPSAAGPVQIPVTLYLWSTPPTLTVTPPAITISANSGSLSAPQNISVQSNEPLVAWGPLIHASAIAGINAPCTATGCVLTANPILPGAYYGTLQFYLPNGATEAPTPVTVLGAATTAQPPVIASVVNAATQIAGSLSPGEIISLHGIGIGPAAISGYMLNSTGDVSGSLDSVQVLFDGKPAPLLYVSPSQINAIVPFEVGGEISTTIQVMANSIPSAAWAIPVANTAPGIFTLSATGQGPAAVLNQDSSVNSSSKPALRGTAIQIFATGGGQTTPSAETGAITSLPGTLSGVAVTIGGASAQVVYAGAAPGEVAGMIQVNAVVPQAITPGPAVPLSLAIGGISSPLGATIAVQ
jgi:uncharacterized protein (TIGR03437 family)